VAWPRGEAAACKAVYTGSNPVATSLPCTWADGRVGFCVTLDHLLTLRDDGVVRKKYLVPISLSVAFLLGSCVTDTGSSDEAAEDGLPIVLEEPTTGGEVSNDEPGDDKPILSLPETCSGFDEDVGDFGERVGFDTLEDADQSWSFFGVPKGIDVQELGEYRLCIHGLSQSGYFRLFRFQEASPDQWISYRDTLYQEGFRDISVDGYDGVYIEYALDPTGDNDNIVFPPQSRPDLWSYWEIYFYNDGRWFWAMAEEDTFSTDDPYVVLLQYLN